MGIILAIETSTKVCSVAILRDSELLAEVNSYLNNSHSEVLVPSIKYVLSSSGIDQKELDAVAVGSGPGSYTGLRIGVSTAKGMVYALDVPMISISSLLGMSERIRNIFPRGLFCPMIDARRMEVYTLVQRASGEVVQKAKPQVIDGNTFDEYRNEEIYYFGDGAEKCVNVFSGRQNMHYIKDVNPSAAEIGKLAFDKFIKKDFEDPAYFEPDYLKEFQAKKAKRLI